MGETSVNAAKIRNKAEFLEADDPAQALLRFFESLGATAVPRASPTSVSSHPLILISQLPRSGGSLLCQLFDGHPQLLVFPWEMRIGHPKDSWPVLHGRDTPDRLFANLFQVELAYLARAGYRKRGKVKQKQKRLKFDYSPVEHYQSFVRLLPARPNSRAVLDTYFSTFFQSWHPEHKDAAYLAGFVPKMAASRDSIRSFFRDYPDGRLISIIRDPADWFASRRAHTKGGLARYDVVETEMALWNQMAERALQYRRDYGDRFLLVPFKDLVTDREGTMRRVCDWCGIDFDPCVLEQTFDGQTIAPNTNFDDPVDRLAEAVLHRKQCLPDGDRQRAYQLTERSRLELHRVGWTA